MWVLYGCCILLPLLNSYSLSFTRPAHSEKLSYRHCRRSKSLPIINRRYTTGVAVNCLSLITRISAAADQQRSLAMRGHSVQTSSDSLAFQLWRYGISFGRRRLLVSARQSYLIMSVWIIMPCWCILRNEISSSSHHVPIFQFIFLFV